MFITPHADHELILTVHTQIRYCGYSEITADELRRAHAVCPVTAIQMEWSLQSRDIETSVVPVARELGIGIVVMSQNRNTLLSVSVTPTVN